MQQITREEYVKQLRLHRDDYTYTLVTEVTTDSIIQWYNSDGDAVLQCAYHHAGRITVSYWEKGTV